MLLNNIAPSGKLKEYVRFYRIVDFDFTNRQGDATNVKAYRPRIEHCLQFTPFDTETVYSATHRDITCKVAIFGQHTMLTNRKVGRRFLNFQVVFQPGVLPALLKLPATHLTNVYTDAGQFLGDEVHEVNHGLARCTNYHEMIAVVERFLNAILGRASIDLHPVVKVAGWLSQPFDHKDISWYAGQANLSYRQFDRAFLHHTGIAPKDFRNLIKLDTAYLLKNRKPDESWTGIALQSGFYDYQHLCKTYVKFTGYSPTQFQVFEQQAPERLFGDYEH